jgi:predicted DsbA family dithiol-disulfide isomerase
MINIDLWSDFSCPFCYIGKARLERVLKELKLHTHVHIHYKSYQLNPFAPATVEENAFSLFSKKMGISIDQAIEKFAHVIQLAEEESLTMDYQTIQMTNTFDAHRLMKYATSLGKDQGLTTRLMKAYFDEGKNLADLSTLVEIATSVGLDRQQTKDMLHSNEFEGDVQNDLQEAKAIGVRGVPFFVFNQRYAISGAQSYEHFKQLLTKIMKEENITPSSLGDQCEDEGCAIE